MNLRDAQLLEVLRAPVPQPTQKVKTAIQIAKRVFTLAAAGGFPYKKSTPEKWAKKWLSSDKFILMEIDINAAAAPHRPKNPNRVSHYFQCNAGALDPVVVDINKRKVGTNFLGYVPDVIFLDGKHRRTAMRDLGHTRILAWVGCKAARRMKPHRIVNASASDERLVSKSIADGSKFAMTYELYATTTPALGAPVPRQDVGEGGARPTGIRGKKAKMKAKNEDMCGCGARSSGSYEDPDASDEKVPPDASDAGTFVDPSDRTKFDGKKPNNFAPGTYPGYVDEFGSPNFQAPGAGSGPRVTNKGASTSEFRKSPDMKAAGKIIKHIFQEKDASDVDAVAPPGREDQVLELKKHFGKKSAIPFKIAWSQHNKKKSHNREA